MIMSLGIQKRGTIKHSGYVLGVSISIYGSDGRVALDSLAGLVNGNPANVRKAAFVDNWSIFYLACASFLTRFVSKMVRVMARFSCSSQSDIRQFLLTKIAVDVVSNSLKHELRQSINLKELYFLYLENNRRYPVIFSVTQDTSSFLSTSLLTVEGSSSCHLLGTIKWDGT